MATPGAFIVGTIPIHRGLYNDQATYYVKNRVTMCNCEFEAVMNDFNGMPPITYDKDGTANFSNTNYWKCLIDNKDLYNAVFHFEGSDFDFTGNIRFKNEVKFSGSVTFDDLSSVRVRSSMFFRSMLSEESVNIKGDGIKLESEGMAGQGTSLTPYYVHADSFGKFDGVGYVELATVKELAKKIDSVSYDDDTHIINFFSDNEKVASLDAAPFIVDGMVENVYINDSSELVVKFNTAAGGREINIPLPEIFNPDNYYTKSEIDEKVAGKQDTLISGTNIKTVNGQSVLGAGNVSINTSITSFDDSKTYFIYEGGLDRYELTLTDAIDKNSVRSVPNKDRVVQIIVGSSVKQITDLFGFKNLKYLDAPLFTGEIEQDAMSTHPSLRSVRVDKCRSIGLQKDVYNLQEVYAPSAMSHGFVSCVNLRYLDIVAFWSDYVDSQFMLVPSLLALVFRDTEYVPKTSRFYPPSTAIIYLPDSTYSSRYKEDWGLKVRKLDTKREGGYVMRDIYASSIVDNADDIANCVKVDGIKTVNGQSLVGTGDIATDGYSPADSYVVDADGNYHILNIQNNAISLSEVYNQVSNARELYVGNNVKNLTGDPYANTPDYKDSITKVVLPSSVTSIPSSYFAGLKGLQEVNWDIATDSSVGSYAFASGGLRRFVTNPLVTISVDGYAFAGTLLEYANSVFRPVSTTAFEGLESANLHEIRLDSTSTDAFSIPRIEGIHIIVEGDGELAISDYSRHPVYYVMPSLVDTYKAKVIGGDGLPFAEVRPWHAEVYTSSEVDEKLNVVDTALTAKQDALVSGTNIKTVNGQSVLGEGDIALDNIVWSGTQAEFEELEDMNYQLYIIKDEISSVADTLDLPDYGEMPPVVDFDDSENIDDLNEIEDESNTAE